MCKPSETRFKDDFYEQNSIFWKYGIWECENERTGNTFLK
jgi:hypothetical protein